MSTSTTVGLRSERGPILLALMLATALIALDATILATAVPSIVDDLGGLTQFPWLFSVYLLAQAVSVPVYAKLADTVGRKPVILFGIGLFLIGRILCGFAWSMGSLIAMRALQGLGAGAVLPLTTTIAGDIYTVAERAKTQGYIASVWAVSSVVGPTLGGVFSQFASWRWIFFINIPFCLLAAGMLWRNYDESVERRKHRIDYAGAVVLTVALTLLILAVLEGGQAWAWSSWQSVGSFVVGGAAAGRLRPHRAAGRRADPAARDLLAAAHRGDLPHLASASARCSSASPPTCRPSSSAPRASPRSSPASPSPP